MSTVDANTEVATDPVKDDGLEITQARLATVGDITVRRLLPLRLRRSVGPWCFVDHYGPESVDGIAGMQVPPHPHIGLQTVTWLLAGDVLHRDSLGSEQMIRPGQLNLMTAGRGIAHAEESPAEHDPVLHGVQLWVALPEATRHVAPAFEHHPQLPVTRIGDFMTSVFMGELAGARSDATAFSPIVGAELTAVGAAGRPGACCRWTRRSSTSCSWWPARPKRRASAWDPAGCSTCRRAASGPAWPRPRAAACSCSAARRWASNC